MKTLVHFDIDGTVTETNAVDNTCYLQVLSELLDGAAIDSDWTH